MLKKYRISSYAIIIGIALVILSPVIGCAQNEGNALTSTGQGKKKPGLQRNQITKTVKFQDQLSISAKFSEKEHLQFVNSSTLMTLLVQFSKQKNLQKQRILVAELKICTENNVILKTSVNFQSVSSFLFLGYFKFYI